MCDFSTADTEQVMTKMKSFGYDELYLHPVRLSNYKLIITKIQDEFVGREFVVLNLCDGMETDNYPGISVVKELERCNIAFTGAGSLFFQASSSKIYMKQKFFQNNVPTPPFVIINRETLEEDVRKAVELIGFPIIIKPSGFYSSFGIYAKSVVFNESDAVNVAKQEGEGKEIFAERFLPGREFSVCVSGDKEQGAKTLPPVEMNYDSTLASHLKLQTFDDKVYTELEYTEHGVREVCHWMSVIKDDESKAIENIAKDAYLAIEGSGYGRVDIRSDEGVVNVSNLYILEVNANPLTHLHDVSTLTAIIRLAKESNEEVTHGMIKYAMKRKEERRSCTY